MLVKTKVRNRHELVYKLLKLVLVLPVATASVERIFSAMNYVKNKLRNKIQQQRSLFSQASWDRLEMKPERNKFKVQAH